MSKQTGFIFTTIVTTIFTFHTCLPSSSFSGTAGFKSTIIVNPEVTNQKTKFSVAIYERQNHAEADQLTYTVVDTNQTDCYDDAVALSFCPERGHFSGQDGQHTGTQPKYSDNGDGTVSDLNTGLMWQQSPDTNNDGIIDAADKLTYEAAVARADTLYLGGYNDWRLPTIKELYSLIDFSGRDPSGYNGRKTSNIKPFINTAYFAFAYGDTRAGERMIESQYASSTLYTSVTNNNRKMFGVNFADGRIKGYGLHRRRGWEKAFFVIYVRGNTNYGKNDFHDNKDGTISDRATGLMWSREDSQSALSWQEALAWVQTKNAENYLGYNDWRLPDAKELQSLVDYSRSPDTTGSAAINALFSTTSVLNETVQVDYPSFWTSTTHLNWTLEPGRTAVYIAFGRAMGYMNGRWVDVHGAGSQRSDPKSGNPNNFSYGRGPQGDAIRIYNYVRPVRYISQDSL